MPQGSSRPPPRYWGAPVSKPAAAKVPGYGPKCPLPRWHENLPAPGSSIRQPDTWMSLLDSASAISIPVITFYRNVRIHCFPLPEISVMLLRPGFRLLPGETFFRRFPPAPGTPSRVCRRAWRRPEPASGNGRVTILMAAGFPSSETYPARISGPERYRKSPISGATDSDPTSRKKWRRRKHP